MAQKSAGSGQPPTLDLSGSRPVEAGGPVPCNLTTRSFWTTAVPNKKDAARLLIVMRGMERVDRVMDREWTDTEAPIGKLEPTDLNVPQSLRSIVREHDLYDDPPISTMGKYMAQMTARALLNRGLAPETIICSPALRCIQTASAIAGFLKSTVSVEPGLFEATSWYRKEDTLQPIPFINIETLAAKGYKIDLTYSPLVSLDALFARVETEAASRRRVDFAIRQLASQPRHGPLLIVGHALTCDVAATIGKGAPVDDEDANMTSPAEEPEWDDLHDSNVATLGLRFPPGAVLTLSQWNEAPPFVYRNHRHLVPPLSYGQNFSNSPIF